MNAVAVTETTGRSDHAVDVALAWTDLDYRAVLNPAQLAALPNNPIGDLQAVKGDDTQAADSFWITIISPAGCWFTLACTGPCCAW